jgi:DNA excision repair protein ERCC-4
LNGKSEERARVYIDTREKGSPVASLLEKRLLVVYKRLDVGDYLISNEIVIERKSISDYMKSIYDGRLFDQAYRMVSTYSLPILIIEGGFVSYKDKYKFNSSLASLLVKYGIRVVMTQGPSDTADLIYYIAKKIHSSKGQFIVVHKKPKLSDPREWQLYIAQSLPNIGPKLASRLLEHFGSIEKIVNASISELANVPGIGEKRAIEIYKILHMKYEARKGRTYHLDEFS